MPVKYEEAERDQRLAFEKAFRNLLHLQDMCVSPVFHLCHTDLFISGKSLQPTGSEPTKTVPLYALQALVVPVALRFKFHFDGDRPTNRPDKVGHIHSMIGTCTDDYISLNSSSRTS